MPSPEALFRVNTRRLVALFSSLLIAVFIGVAAFSPLVLAPENAYAESGTVSNLGSGSGLDRIAHPELESGADSNPHCGLFDIGCATVEALTGLLDVVVQGINLLLIGLLAMISFLFDWVSIQFVIQMGKFVTSPDAAAIRTAWTLIRDLANIGIIGGLVATAIGTILGNDKYNVNKTLARIILAALLVNFSYFFAGALIDASNFLAKQAFQTIYRDNCSEANQCGPASRFLAATHLDDAISTLNSASQPAVGLNGGSGNAQEILRQQSGNQSTYTNAHTLVYHIMQSIFIIVTSFVFLSTIALLIARFISLLFLLITSPIGIAGTAIPILQSYASEWWKALRSQALFAPVYFLLAGISLNILDALRGALLYTGPGNVTATGIIAMFIIAIGFMWASLSIAKSMSAEAKWFSDIYKQAGNAFGWLPGAYTGSLRYGGGLILRDTVGRQADRWRQQLPGFSNRVREWAKDSRIGQALSAIPGIKTAASAADRALQKQLDKTADQKFLAGKDGKGGAAGFKSFYDEREKRQRELQAKKEALENEDKYDGREARKKLDTKERGLKDKIKADTKEIADLEKNKNRTPQEEAKLKAARDRLENNQKELKGIAAFRANLKAHPNDGVTKKNPNDPNSEEVESAELNKLHAERQALIAKGDILSPEEAERLENGKRAGTLNQAELERLERHRTEKAKLDGIEARIKSEEEFEKQKDDNEWGGIMGRQRRGQAKLERAVAAGEKAKDVNEKARAESLEAKRGDLDDNEYREMQVLERQAAKNPAAFSETDPGKKGALQVKLEKYRARVEMSDTEDAAYREKRDSQAYKDAVAKPEGERSQAEKDLIKDVATASRKLTKFQKAERDFYREQSKPLTVEENKKLDDRIKDRDAGKITDPKQLAEIDRLERRRRVGGIEGVAPDVKKGIGIGLSENAVENDYAYRNRQAERDKAVRRGVTEEFNKDTGVPDFKLEDDYGYKYRLETGEVTGRLRDAIGEGKNIAGTLGIDYLKAEYRKNPRSILKYALTLSDEDTEKFLADHSINEEIRNEISLRRMQRFTKPFLELQQDLIDGKVQWGSEEYNRRKNDLFNQQTRYLPGKEVLAALKANAVIGELHNHKTGEPMHVRIKDLNSDTGKPEDGGFGNLRRLFWHSTSSTMFANAKESNIFGRELTAEMGRDKRGGPDGTDRHRDIDHSMYEIMGYSDGKDFTDKDFLQSTAGKVQMYAITRDERAMRELADESKTSISRYGQTGDTQTLNDVIVARQNARLAQMYQDAKRGNGIFKVALENVLTPQNIAAAKTRAVQALRAAQEQAEIPEELRATEKDFEDADIKSFLIRQKMHELRTDPTKSTDDQKFFFKMEADNKRAARDRANGWTETEAAAAWNERSLHSPIIAETIKQTQIPAVLKGKDPVDAERFWESYFMLRNSGEIYNSLRNEAIKPYVQYPSKKKLQIINLKRIANGDDVLNIPTSD